MQTGRMVYSAVAAAQIVVGSIREPPPMLVDMSASTWEEKAVLPCLPPHIQLVSAMLTSVESPGVAPEVNLRIRQARKRARDPPWL